jgi:osmoprotectant transport system ATP-binding protein
VVDADRFAITLERVTKRFGPVTAVSDVSFTVAAGEICVVIGPSGSGKTTVLKMINRVIEPTEGSIRVRGRDIRALEAVELRRSIGYVIQHVGLFPHMSIAENIAIPLRLRGIASAPRRARAAALLDLVGLDMRLLDRRPLELSGGQQQRVGVARALAGDPDIVLMDEPFGAVDPLLRRQLQRELKQIQRRVHKTIVLVTHDLAEAFLLADRLIVMKDGRVVQEGTPRTLVLSPQDTFVRKFISDIRATDVLRLTCLRDIAGAGGPGRVEAQELPGEMSLLVALETIARKPAGTLDTGTFNLVDDAGSPFASLELGELLQAVARIVVKEPIE